MIKNIFFTNKLYTDYSFENKNNTLSHLGKLNIFIGQNNTGKSRFLRSLFSDVDFEFEFFAPTIFTIRSFFESMKLEVSKALVEADLTEADGVFKKINELGKNIKNFQVQQLEEDIKVFKDLAEYYLSIETLKDLQTDNHGRNPELNSFFLFRIKDIGKAINKFLEFIFRTDIIIELNEFIYLY